MEKTVYLMMDEDILDLLKKGRYKEIITHLEREENLNAKIKRLALITCYVRSGQMKEALDLTTQFMSKTEDNESHAELCAYKAHILERMGEYKKSQLCLNLLDDQENNEIIVLKKIVTGNLDFARGEYDNATKGYEEALEIAFRDRMLEWQIRLLVNLANINVIQGKYGVAEMYYHDATSINDDYADIYYSGYILSGLADLHVKLEQYDQAERLLNQAKEIRKPLGNQLELAYCLLQMVILNTNKLSTTIEVQPLIAELQQLQAETENHRIHVFALFGLALYRKSEGTLEDISEAEKMLLKIVQFKEYSYSISIQAMYHLFEIRLVEYRFNRKPEMLTSIVSSVQSIIQDLREQDILPREQIKLLLLIAQSYRTLGKFELSIGYLEDGLTIAEKHNLKNYISRLNAVKDYISHLNSDDHRFNIDGNSLVDLTSYLYLLTTQKDTDKLVIHDIKNLIHISLNYLELLDDDIKVKGVLQDTNEEIMALIDMISNNSAHIIQGNLHHQRLDLVKLIKTRINILHSSRSTGEGEIRFQHPSRPIYLKIPRMDYIRVIDNLLINAIEYAEKDTDIHLDLTVNRDQILLNIENICDPIPADIQDRLFETSTRWVDNELVVSDSRGLGLSSIKKIVNSLNGSIGLHSPIPTNQRGVRISLKLPYL